MKITYFNHSGFLLETETAYFIFDYYKGMIPELGREKPVVVFVSHSHGDHYNREIYQLLRQYPAIRFVLAKDIPTKRLIAEQLEQGVDLSRHIISIGKNTTLELQLENAGELRITTLKSTDAGVAFLLEYHNRVYYHAGDLNLWCWKGESKQYNDNMTRKFMTEMEKLRGLNIDAAFIPLDPRLQEYSMEGLRIFLEYTNAQWVFPMHMWGAYEIIPEFLNKYPQYQEQIAVISREGQVFLREED